MKNGYLKKYITVSFLEMKNTLLKTNRRLLLIFVWAMALIGLTMNVHAQTITENFEEAEWQTVATTSSGTTNSTNTTGGTVVITAYNGGTNSTANIGSWRYSAAYLVTNNAANSKSYTVHGGTYAMHYSSNGAAYIMTPLLPNGVTSISFWARTASTSATTGIFIGTNQTFTSVASMMAATKLTEGGWYTSNFSVINSTAGWSQVSMNVTGNASTAPCYIKICRTSNEATIDDVVITTPSTCSTPTLSTTAQASGTVCPGTNATINLTGLTANSTDTINYNIASGSNNKVTVTANSSGAASFTVPVTDTNNGQTLTITKVSITSCNFTPSSGNTVSLAVSALPTAPSGLSKTANCNGTANLTYSGSPGTDTWYWQTGTAAGDSLKTNSGTPYAVSASGTYYLRAKSTAGCWSAYGSSPSVTVASADLGTTPSISNWSSPSATSPALSNASTVTVNSTSIGAGTYTVTYNLSGANTATAATATLTMGASTGTFTIPGSSLASAGSTTVTITAIASGTCSTTVSSSNTATFTVTSNTAPTFVTASPTLSICQDASATSVVSLLHVSDADASQTLTWTQSAAPSHGTLSFSSATATSGSTDVTPGGTITYTPTASYNGTDAFTVQVSDGTATATVTVNVTVNALPATPTGVTSNTPQCAGTGITFSSSASAPSNETWYWQSSTSGTNTTGYATPYTSASTAGTYTYYLRSYKSTTGCWSAATSAVAATINAAPSITAQPSSATATISGSAASMSVTASNATSYQWQYCATSGGTYANVVNGTPTGVTYSGATGSTLSITAGATASAGTAYYKCVVAGSSPCSDVTSSSGTLTISAASTSSCYQVGSDGTGSHSSYDFGDYVLYFTSTGGGTFTASTISGSASNVCNSASYRFYMANAVVYLEGAGASEILFEGQQTYNLSVGSVYTADALSGPYTALGSYTGVNYTSSSCGTLGITGVSIPQGKYVMFAFNGTSPYEFRISGICVSPILNTPTVTTQAASSITTTQGVANGTITSIGASAVTTSGFCYNTTGSPTISDNPTTDGPTTATTYNKTISSLTANTNYYVKAYATNSSGTGYGSQVTLLTLPGQASVAAESSVTSTGFTANWTAPVGQGAATFTYTVEVDDNSDFSSLSKSQTGIASGTTSYAFTGLSSSTTYYYRVKAVNATGSGAYSATYETVTTNAASPTVTSTTVSSITTTTASAGGNVTSDGGSTVTARGTAYGTSANPTSGTSDGTGTGSFTSSISGLTANTVYYYRAYATSTNGTGYGTETTFTTLSLAPTIAAGSGATSTAITANWTAPATQGSATYTYTVEIDNNSDFSSVTATQTGIASGTLSYTFSGLTAGTTYYYRVKAVNAGGSSDWSATSTGYATSAVPSPYACEGFEDAAWSAIATGSSTSGTVSSSTGDWYVYSSKRNTSTKHAGANSLNPCNSSSYIQTPALPNGLGTITLWAYNSGVKTMWIHVYNSSNTLLSGDTITSVSGVWTQYTYAVNNASASYVRIVRGSDNNTFIDDVCMTSCGTPAIAIADNGTQVAAGNITAGASKNSLLSFTLANTGTGSGTVSSVAFTTTGTATGSDLTNFKLYYKSSNDLSTATLLSTLTGGAAGTYAFSSLTQAIAANATGYFWITTDVASGATVGHDITVSATPAVTLSSTTVTGTTSAGGTQTIVAAATPPTLIAATGATVDAAFDVTFTDNSTWRDAITSITVGGTTLSASAYSISSGKITFTPSVSALLQSSGTKTIVVIATGYSNATVSQDIAYGAANKLAISTQPTAPSSNGGSLGTTSVVVVQDKYGNTVANSTASITAAVGSGSWTIGGTTTVSASAGSASFTALTASSSAAVSATITYSASGLTSITSSAFTIPAPASATVSETFVWLTSSTSCSGASTTAKVTTLTDVSVSGGTLNSSSYSITAAGTIVFTTTLDIQSICMLAKVQDASIQYSYDNSTWTTLTSLGTTSDQSYSSFGTIPANTRTFYLKVPSDTKSLYLKNMTFTLKNCTPPTISSITGPQTICSGSTPSSLSVSASANSGGGLTYQWYNESGSISGETSSTYSPGALTATKTYYCKVTETGCVATSNNSVVTVNGLPTITAQSTATQTVEQNATATAMTVTASGAGITYQWYSNASATNTGGTIISGATSSSYTPSTSALGNSYYYCVVSGTCTPTDTSAVSGAIIVTPSVSAPTTQATNITFSSVTTSSLTIGLTRGNGANVAIFVKAGSGTITNPTNGSSYTASTTFSSGSQLGSSGYYCVYNGSDTPPSVTVTGLTAGTTYYVQAFEYNGTGSATKYYTSTATGNPSSETTTGGATPYTYTLETFESGTWPASSPSVETAYTVTTGTWKDKGGYSQTSTKYAGTYAGLFGSSGNYYITPYLSNGADSITVYLNSGGSSRPCTVATSVDGSSWTTVTTFSVSTSAWVRYAYRINSSTTRYVKLTVSGGGGLYIDNFLITPTTTAPIVTTQAVSSVGETTATGNGTIVSTGNSAITSSGVCWSTTSGSETATSGTAYTTDGRTTVGAYISAMTGLTGNTKYYVKAYATSGVGTGYGDEVNFVTLPSAPTVGTASSVTGGGFTSEWTAPTQGGQTFTYTVEVSTANGASFDANVKKTITGVSSSSTSSAITGLCGQTTYYYRVKAVNATGAGAWSDISSSITTSAGAPTVTTEAVDANTLLLTGATLPGTIVQDGGASVSVSGFKYSKVLHMTSGITTTTDGGTSIGAISSSVTGLAANTKYYYIAYATNTYGTAIGDTLSFVTLPNIPTPSTSSDVLSAGFTANWTVPTQGAELFTYVIEVTTTSNNYSSPVLTISNISSIDHSHVITGLDPSTTYYYHIKAVSLTGKTLDWSSQSASVTTLAPPVLTVTFANGTVKANNNVALTSGAGSTRTSNELVGLKATPNSGYGFLRWVTPDGRFTSDTITVTMDQSKDITAQFAVSPVDFIAPSLTFSPLNGATNVLESANLTITSNEPLYRYISSSDTYQLLTSSVVAAMDSSTKASFLTLVDVTNANAYVPFALSIDADGKVLTINPTSNLDYTHQYKLTVNYLCDANENMMASALYSQFTVRRLPQPEIQIEEVSTAANIATGSTVNMGVYLSGGAKTKTYRIINLATYADDVLHITAISSLSSYFSTNLTTQDVAAGDTVIFTVTFNPAADSQSFASYSSLLRITNNDLDEGLYDITFTGGKAGFTLPYKYESGCTTPVYSSTQMTQDYTSLSDIPSAIALGSGAMDASHFYSSYNVFQVEGNCMPSGSSALRVGQGSNKLVVTIPADKGCGRVTLKWCANGYRKVKITDAAGNIYEQSPTYLVGGSCYTTSTVVNVNGAMTLNIEFVGPAANTLTTLYYMEITPYSAEIKSSAKNILAFSTTNTSEKVRIYDNVIFVSVPSTANLSALSVDSVKVSPLASYVKTTETLYNVDSLVYTYTVTAQDGTTKLYTVYVEHETDYSGTYNNYIDYEVGMNKEDQVLEVLEISKNGCIVPITGNGGSYTIYYLDDKDMPTGGYKIGGLASVCIGSTATYSISNAPKSNNPSFTWNLTYSDPTIADDQKFTVLGGTTSETLKLQAPQKMSSTDITLNISVQFSPGCAAIEGTASLPISATDEPPTAVKSLCAGCVSDGKLLVTANGASKTATTYNWLFTPSIPVIAQSDSAIVLNVGTSASDILASVTTQNGCGLTPMTTAKGINYATNQTTWNGSHSEDWNDAANWSGRVPQACTNVTIPDVSTLSYYPTIHTEKGDTGVCHYITFEPGGAVLGLHKLTYQKAFVKMSLARDKWYTLTAPLKEMYSGDYFFNGAPITYMRLFDGYNPDSLVAGHLYSGTWTKTFKNQQVALTPGGGFVFKVDKNSWNYPSGKTSSTSNKAITFPRMNSDSSLVTVMIPYSELNGKAYPALTSYLTKDADKAYRFAMEGDNHKWTPVPKSVVTGLNLVGNPMMTHLDFTALKSSNSNISATFRIWNGTNFVTCNTAASDLWSDLSYSGHNIAPMQSFLVDASGAGNVNFDYATQFVADKATSLRSTTSKENVLYVSTKMGTDKSSTAIALRAGNKNGYERALDDYKLFTPNTEVPDVYTLSDGVALDINLFGEVPYITPVGIKTTQKGVVSFTFKGADSFKNVDVHLINAMTGETQDLKENPAYTLDMSQATSTEGTLFVEFRNATVTSDVQSQSSSSSSVQIFTKGDNTIKVVSAPDNKIKEIAVFDDTGKLIVKQKDLNVVSQEILMNNGNYVYLVKVLTEKDVKVSKVMIK